MSCATVSPEQTNKERKGLLVFERFIRKADLSDMYDDQGFVFTRELGDPLNTDTVSATRQRISQQGGVQGMRLHDLRHFHATMLLRTGTHLKVVQERLGHSEIDITLNIYSHVVPGLQEQAARAFAEAMDKAKKQPS